MLIYNDISISSKNDEERFINVIYPFKIMEATLRKGIINLVVSVSMLGITTPLFCQAASQQKEQFERAGRPEGIELREGYYNGNRTLDKFYMIDGQKVPVEVDGRPVSEYFHR